MSELFEPPSRPAPEEPGQPQGQSQGQAQGQAQAQAQAQGQAGEPALKLAPAPAGKSRMRPVVISILVIALLGGGGYFAWQRGYLPLDQITDQINQIAARYIGKLSDAVDDRPKSAAPETPLSQARAELAAAKAEIARLKEIEDAAKLMGRANELNDQIAGLDAELASRAKENAGLAANKDALEAEIEDLGQDRDNAAAALEEIRIEQEATRDDIDSRRKQALQVIRRFETVKSEIKARIAENEALKKKGEALKAEGAALTKEVETLRDTVQERKQVLTDLADRLLKAAGQLKEERTQTLAALEGMEKFRQAHIERLNILRKEYIKIAARNIGIKRERYRDIVADVADDMKDVEDQSLDQPEEETVLQEIADQIKQLREDITGSGSGPEDAPRPDAAPSPDDRPSPEKNLN